MRTLGDVVLTIAVALVAAGAAALGFAVLPLAWFVALFMLCALLASAAAGLARRRRQRAARKAVADAQAARLAQLRQRVQTTKARERALEKAQLAVIENFRREYGL